MNNPFSLSFGSIPQNEIKRVVNDFDIVSDFNQERCSSYAYMITGVRGSGKTVYMTDICKSFKDDEKWIVIEVSPEEDILMNIAYRLSKDKLLSKLIVNAGINLSILNIGIEKSIDNSAAPVSILVEELLGIVKSRDKRVLVAIDEAVNNRYIKEFAHQFQMYLRSELPIYLIMTGLFENIYELQNEKTLTFLYRTPRIELKPLKLFLIKESYQEIFDISEDTAKQMAEMTKGYPFAYQVLGYLYYQNAEKDLKKIENKYCNFLGEYVYDKIWLEMSPKDKEVVAKMTDYSGKIRVKDFRDALSVDSSTFSHYRDRLKRKGIVDVSEYGYIDFLLPYFGEYIIKAYL